MAGLRPPQGDIGTLTAPVRFCLALFATFAIAVVALGLLDRLGVGGQSAQIVIAASLGLYACVALAGHSRRPTDFYLVGRAVPASLGGMAAVSGLAGLLMVGLPGDLSRIGVGVVTFVAGILVGLAVLGTLIAPGLRRFGAYTVGDFLAHRGGGMPARLAASFVGFVASFMLLLAALTTAATLLSNIFGLPDRIGLYAAAVLAALPAVAGGLRSLTWVKLVEFFILAAGCLVPAGFLAARSTVTSPAPAAGASPVALAEALGGLFSGVSSTEIVLPALILGAGIASLPHVLAHGLAARSPRGTSQAMLWAALFAIALLAAGVVLAQTLGALGAGEARGGQSFAPDALLFSVLPAVLIGLVMAGVLAAIQALGQAALFSGVAALGHDLWDEAIDRSGTEGRRILIARLAAIGLAGAAAWLLQRLEIDPQHLVRWALALAAGGLFSPLLLSLWWPRCSGPGVVAGIWGGFAMVTMLFLADSGGMALPQSIGPAFGATSTAAGALGIAASGLLTALVSLRTAAPAPQNEAAVALRGRRTPPAVRERPA